MDELIETILNDARDRARVFSAYDQSFIYSELSDRLSEMSHEVLMLEFGLNEEELE